MIGPYQRTGRKYYFTFALADILVSMMFVKTVKTQVQSLVPFSDTQGISGIVLRLSH